MKTVVSVALAALLAAGLAAQGGVWESVDWSLVDPARIRSLLAADPTDGWKSIPLNAKNDPRHRLPPERTSALLLAVCYSVNAAVVAALVAAGAKADESGGLSPLMYAAEYDPSPAVLDALIAAGAGVRLDQGYAMLARPALTYAAQYNENPEVAADLIRKGGAVNAKVSVLDNMGFTPLMYAAQYNRNPAVVAELLRDGAELDMTDAMGRSALVFAAQYNPEPRVLEALLRAGAKVNIVGRDYYNVGFTPLMYAAISEEKPLDKLALLLAAGADPRARSKEGKTALDYASANPLVPKNSPLLRQQQGS